LELKLITSRKKIIIYQEHLTKREFVNERVSAINVKYAMEDNERRERRDDECARRRVVCKKSEGVLVGEEEIKTAKDSLVYDHSEV